MTIALVSSTSWNNGATSTSPAIATTGANFLVVKVIYYNNGSTYSGLTDSLSNTWTTLSSTTNGTGTLVLYYCPNATVGASHTFTVTGTGIYFAAEVAAFSGVQTATPIDGSQVAATPAGTAYASPGTITPAGAGELVILGLGDMGGNSSTYTVDSGFTIIAQQSHNVSNVGYGSALAYKVQPVSAALTPNFGASNSTGGYAVAAVAFKPGPFAATLSDTAFASDNRGMAGTAATKTIFKVTVSDLSVSSDTPTGAEIGAGTQSDTSTSSEAVTGSYSPSTAFADTATSSEAVTGSYSPSTAFADTATSSEAVTGSYSPSTAFADTATSSDGLTPAEFELGPIVDNPLTSDATTAGAASTYALSDLSATSETPSGALQTAGLTADLSATSDAASATNQSARGTADTLATSDSQSGAVSGGVLVGAVNDTSTSSETPSGVLLPVLAALPDTSTSSDTLSAPAQSARGTTDTSTSSDTTTSAATAGRSLADTAASSDATTNAPVSGSAPASDPVATSDTISAVFSPASGAVSDTLTTSDGASGHQVTAPYTLLAHVSGASPGGGGFTTSSMNSAGATLLVAKVVNYVNAGGDPPTITDSQGNTWLQAVTVNNGNIRATIFYCAGPSTSSSHTFTIGPVAASYASAEILAFSGTLPSPLLGATSSAGTNNVLTIQAGSDTPTANGSLIIAGIGYNNTAATPTIDSGFSVADSSPFTLYAAEGGATAYLVQSTAGLVNPTWTIAAAPPDVTAVSAVFNAPPLGAYMASMMDMASTYDVPNAISVTAPSDTVATSDRSAPAVVSALADTASTGDQIGQYLQALSDVFTASDSLSATLQTAVSQSDAAVSGDSTLQGGPPVQDLVVTSDAFGLTWIETLTDTVTSSDTVGVGRTLMQSLVDIATTSDAVQGGPTVRVNDFVTAVERFWSAFPAFAKSVNDTATTGETLQDFLSSTAGYLSHYSDLTAASDSLRAALVRKHIPPSQVGQVTPYATLPLPILPSGAATYTQNQLASLQKTLADLVVMTPQSATQAPSQLRDGMKRLARYPWWPVSGQTADAWVYWDAASQTWEYETTTPTTTG